MTFFETHCMYVCVDARTVVRTVTVKFVMLGLYASGFRSKPFAIFNCRGSDV